MPYRVEDSDPLAAERARTAIAETILHSSARPEAEGETGAAGRTASEIVGAHAIGWEHELNEHGVPVRRYVARGEWENDPEPPVHADDCALPCCEGPDAEMPVPVSVMLPGDDGGAAFTIVQGDVRELGVAYAVDDVDEMSAAVLHTLAQVRANVVRMADGRGVAIVGVGDVTALLDAIARGVAAEGGED